MLRSFFHLLYGSDPVEFESHLPVREAVKRLSDAVQVPFLSFGFGPEVRGSATESRVSVRRVRSFRRNSFKPYFTGAFVSRGGKVWLRGEYSMHLAVKVFMTVWLGGVLFSTATMILAVVRQGGFNFAPLLGLGMFAFGVALVWLGQRLGREDRVRIAAVIRKALQG